MRKLLCLTLVYILIATNFAWAGGYRAGMVYSATETPMSQGGLWLQGGTTALDWTNVNTNGSIAYGTQTGLESCPSNCNDATAILVGTYPTNQFACGIVHATNEQFPSSGTFEEVEVRLSSALSSHTNTGYELNMRVVPATAISTFTISAGGTGYTVGDVLKVQSGRSATLTVSTVSSGVITAATLSNPGNGYSVTSNIVLVGGTGKGAKANVTAVTGDPARYVQMNAFNGGIGNFTSLDSTLGPGLSEGDLYCGRRVGNVLTTSVNGVDILSHTLAGADPIFTGNPGMGFFYHGGGGSCTPTCSQQDFGFKSFWAGNAVTSLSTTDLSSAITAAADLDVLGLPPGTNSAFNSNVDVPDSKNLWIMGQSYCLAYCGEVGTSASITPIFADGTTLSGSGRLTITSGTNTGIWTQVCGITTSNDEFPLFLANSAAQTSWLRLCHMHLKSGGPWISARTYGDADNIYFDAAANAFSGIRVFESAEDQANGTNWADGGGASWLRANSLGTAQVFYLESSSGMAPSATAATGVSILDGRSGGRVGVRFSYFLNWVYENHDAEITHERSIRQRDLDNNTWDYTVDVNASDFPDRGGTGVIYNECYRLMNGKGFTQNNTAVIFTIQRGPGGVVNGDPWNVPTTPNAMASTTSANKMCIGAAPKTCTSMAQCTGDFAGTSCSPIDGDSNATGYRGRDQIGAGADDPTTGVQGLDPLYMWNRQRCTTAGATLCTCNTAENSYSLNNGTTPITSGADVIPNTVKPSFVGYTFPHPLRLGQVPSGGLAAVTLTPSSESFGGQALGTTSGLRSVSLQNTGTATLNLTSIALTGADAGQYQESSTCGPTLAASASCNISVAFRPTTLGAHNSASITVTSDASSSPDNVTLTGTGVTGVRTATIMLSQR
jgi:hypothetical protein